MQTQYGRPTAAACIRGDENHNGLSGSILFTPCKEGTMITVQIYGLPESETGFFALHIHEGPNCCGTGFPNTRSHYNPCNRQHPDHAGDLPPLLSCNGKAHMEVLTDRFCIREILGRTILIHSGPDDFTTQPAGGAGNKIACGVIRSI